MGRRERPLQRSPLPSLSTLVQCHPRNVFRRWIQTVCEPYFTTLEPFCHSTFLSHFTTSSCLIRARKIFLFSVIILFIFIFPSTRSYWLLQPPSCQFNFSSSVHSSFSRPPKTAFFIVFQGLSPARAVFLPPLPAGLFRPLSVCEELADSFVARPRFYHPEGPHRC